ncbi:hypothetical protein [Syntrophomonas erecta]
MNLVNKQVMHKNFGKGKVVKYNDSYIKIDFPSGNKEFVFPDAFEKYLTFTDQRAANVIEKIVQKRKREYKEEKLRLKKLRTLQKEKRQRLLERERLTKISKAHKIHPRSQIVFWCKAQEQESIFTSWNIFTGVIKSGQKKGQPRRPARINQNSACLLTARDSDVPEKDRRILGLFMVNDSFSGKQCVDGYIPAHSEYRLRLSEQESEKILFWNYYVDERYPHKITWNTGRYRYFDNIWMAQILRDIISLKKNPQEREYVQHFFRHFCHVNWLNTEELPKPYGALMHI